MESLVAVLWIFYGRAISDGRFSYRDGAWQVFDGRELERIELSLTPRA